MQRLQTPLTPEVIMELRSGDQALLSGTVYTARDAAHARLVKTVLAGGELPFPIEGAVLYYVGPTPARPGKVIGSAGPTTSGRMDSYTPELLRRGLKGMIGKGARNQEVRQAIRAYQAVYFGATGGAGALLAQRVKAAEVIAYPELGPEAIFRLEVDELPLIVINDIYGGDLYSQGRQAYLSCR